MPVSTHQHQLQLPCCYHIVRKVLKSDTSDLYRPHTWDAHLIHFTFKHWAAFTSSRSPFRSRTVSCAWESDEGPGFLENPEAPRQGHGPQGEVERARATLCGHGASWPPSSRPLCWWGRGGHGILHVALSEHTAGRGQACPALPCTLAFVNTGLPLADSSED